MNNPAMLSESVGSTQALRTKSDITCLPPEIISHIFVVGSKHNHGDESDEDEGPSAGSSSVDFGTLCSHVCQYWRDIAIDTPQLWTHLDFEEGSPYDKSKEWIVRSKAAPLTLEIEHGGPEDDMDEDERQLLVMDEVAKAATIITLVTPQVHRWQSLDVTADPYEVIYMWQTELRRCSSAPRLEYLALYCHEEWIDADTFHPQALRGPIPIFLSGAPNLQTVILWGVHIDWEAATFLEGLRNLQLAFHTNDVRPSLEQFVRMLTRSPKLETLSLESSAPLSGVWPYERIRLNYLHDLIVTGIDVREASTIIDHLEFPALRCLSLDLEDDNMEPFIDAVCKGKHPRFRDVEFLKLTSFECRPAAGKRFLRSMPNLTSMCLNFNFLPDHFLDALITNQPILLCPKLSTLKLSGLGDMALKGLIAARKATAIPIQRLYIDQDDDLGDDVIDWLKEQVGELSFYEASDDEEDEDEDEDDE